MKARKVLVLCVLLCAYTATNVFAFTIRKERASRVYVSGNSVRAENMGIGLSVGYPGVGAAFEFSQLREKGKNLEYSIQGIISFDYWNGSGVGIDLNSVFKFAEIRLDKNDVRDAISFVAGPGVYSSVAFGNNFQVRLALEGVLGIEYRFGSEKEWKVFLNGHVGPVFTFGNNVKSFIGVYGAGTLGFLYFF